MGLAYVGNPWPLSPASAGPSISQGFGNFWPLIWWTVPATASQARRRAAAPQLVAAAIPNALRHFGHTCQTGAARGVRHQMFTYARASVVDMLISM